MLKNSPFADHNFDYNLEDPVPRTVDALIRFVQLREDALHTTLVGAEPDRVKFDAERLRLPCGTNVLYVRFHDVDRNEIETCIDLPEARELTWAEVLLQLHRRTATFALGSHVYCEDFEPVKRRKHTYRIFQGS